MLAAILLIHSVTAPGTAYGVNLATQVGRPFDGDRVLGHPLRLSDTRRLVKVQDLLSRVNRWRGGGGPNRTTGRPRG